MVETILNVPSADKSFKLRRLSLYKLSLRCNSPEVFVYWKGMVSQLLADVESNTISSDATYNATYDATYDATYWKTRLSIEIIENCLLPLSQKKFKTR